MDNMLGRSIGRMAAAGNSSHLSKASRMGPNDVSTSQMAEGMDRNRAFYGDQVDNVSQQDNAIRQKLQSSPNERSAAGYEGGRNTFIEMDNTGYQATGKARKASRGINVGRPVQNNINTSQMLPNLFNRNLTNISDYRSFTGNL